MAVPGAWLGDLVKGEALPKFGYGTYRLKVLLPEDPTDLALSLSRFQSAYRLYVNGQLFMHSGRPADNASEEQPFISRNTADLKGAKGSLDIVLHASNFVGYAGGGFIGAITMGNEYEQNQSHFQELSRDTFLSGAMICLGAFLMVLHIGRYRERVYFVLYAMSFLTAGYILTVSSTLLELSPLVPWYWNERLSYVCATFLIALTYEFIHQVNPRKTSFILSHIILYQAVGISLYLIFWPAALPIETILLIGVHLAVVSISCLLEIRYVLKYKIAERWLIVAGIVTLVVVGVHDILHANSIVNTTYLGPYGTLALLFLYAAILALRVNSSIIQNEQFAEAIRSLDDAVAIFDRNDRIVVWNDAYKLHLSKDAQSLLKPGRTFGDLVKADAFSKELPHVIGREADYIKERIGRHKRPGETFEMKRNEDWYLYREACTPDGGRVTLANNLAQQKAKESELRQALEEVIAANEAKNSFLSNMSHELRTPLNAINGFSEMMVKGILGPLNSQYQDYAEHISRSGRHLLRLVTDMLDVARIESGKLEIVPEETDLHRLLDDCVLMETEKMQAKGLNFISNIPDDLPKLYVDPDRIRQIIINLLDNAIKFTNSGGQVSVSAQVVSNGGIKIEISDTGIGIAEKNIETALQKFGQIRQSHLNAHDGLGLGLSISKVLVELHGGTLDLESQEGKGTTITLCFPSYGEAGKFFESSRIIA
ncbi:hypothetical protein GUA87_15290 [Sneathiella sp. P13V-1]|uniref:sensor histidine kinase n=1 Tax=Sneathiella sp. P13V-1 TaxID=2697366 RepID=UPI00187B1144|nr:ATP-binding protein [Sneathiella sp. P13V-1]MBE7638222.1 hypothetical protein [Sneathiella sp. P13V-1]